MKGGIVMNKKLEQDKVKVQISVSRELYNLYKEKLLETSRRNVTNDLIYHMLDVIKEVNEDEK